MSMKAVVRGRAGTATEATAGVDVSPEDIPQGDGVVPVLFPAQTWEKVKEMAVAYKVRPAEVLMLALEHLDKEIRGKDGS